MDCLNNNSGVLSLILSVIAVFTAVFIPSIIAHRQNKIALFEKRYEYYSNLLDIYSILNAYFKDHGNEYNKSKFLKYFDELKFKLQIRYDLIFVESIAKSFDICKKLFLIKNKTYDELEESICALIAFAYDKYDKDKICAYTEYVTTHLDDFKKIIDDLDVKLCL